MSELEKKLTKVNEDLDKLEKLDSDELEKEFDRLNQALLNLRIKYDKNKENYHNNGDDLAEHYEKIAYEIDLEISFIKIMKEEIEKKLKRK